MAKISAHLQNILNLFALFNWQHRIKEIGGVGYREFTVETLTNLCRQGKIFSQSLASL